VKAVAYTTIVLAPWGSVRVTEGDQGVVTVELRPGSEQALSRRLEKALGREVTLRARSGLVAARQIAEYFAGKRQQFAVPIDFSLADGFALRVLRALRRIGYGETTSYGALAARAGSPGAARAVGAVMRKNPLPLIVPCHRVLAAGGALGGFTGGLEIKRRLLKLESRSL
jgi:methylated-DNA-[protein]-cysteine S-methyltransferase